MASEQKSIGQESSRPLPSLKDLFDVGAKIFLACSLFLYVLGFIVVTLFLRGYGYSATNFLEPQYLLAGFWALLPLVLSWALFGLIVEKLEPLFELPKRAFILAVLGVAAVFVASGLLLTFGYNWIRSLELEARWAIIAPSGFVLSFVLLGFLWSSQSAWRHGTLSRTEVVGRALFMVGVFGVLGWAYLANFSGSLYGDIPAALGGGRGRHVKLILKQYQESEKRALNSALTAKEGMTGDVLLLGSTEDDLLILSDDLSTLTALSRESVRAIVYEGR